MTSAERIKVLADYVKLEKDINTALCVQVELLDKLWLDMPEDKGDVIRRLVDTGLALCPRLKDVQADAEASIRALQGGSHAQSR